MTKDIVTNCLLCAEHGLHLIGEGREQMHQCLNCGYMSNEQLNGKADNTFFREMGETIKKWAKYTDDRIWIPVQLTLPIGALYPVDIKGDMKWAFVRIIDIPEDEQEEVNSDILKDESRLYNKKFDEENPEIFNTFLNGFARMNDLLKKMSTEESNG